MFNLLVSSNPTQWETDQLMRMDVTRFKEYSHGIEAEAVSLSSPETLRLLEQVPALLMYEDATDSPNCDIVRYGFLREINVTRKELTFQFVEEGHFTKSVVKEFGDRLDIHPWEYGHTHWAIKDGRLPSAMLTKLRPVYDVVLSFAGEDRKYVERVAKYLQSKGVRIFYDTFEEAYLWGKDLAEHLDSIYQQAAQYCVAFVSKYYLEKMWTRHERRSALARALREKTEYILPARFDATELPGIPNTIGYISLAGKNPAALGKLILKKLGRQTAKVTGQATSTSPRMKSRGKRKGLEPDVELLKASQPAAHNMGIPSDELDVSVHYGFKKITLGNWAKSGFPTGFSQITPQNWITNVLKVNLNQNVPEKIRALYEVARGACVYAIFFYPLMTIGAQQCFRVLEAAVAAKREELGLPTPKPPSFRANIELLVTSGVIPQSDMARWDLVRQLRNMFSHLSYQEIMTPGEVLRVLRRTEEALNKLFS